ncbi:MAG: SMI1/KNR4 family protein [Ruminococcus sp.]|nr:SMI1/KNR4 family protein [Ruminococcus sp.]
MDNKFYCFLQSLDDISFVQPITDELNRLYELSSGKLPEMFIEVYSQTVPECEVNFDSLVFYDIKRIIDENTEYIPGANILPFGFFTFASTLDGDGICFDLNNKDFPVYCCPHEIFCDENEINYCDNGKILTAELNYSNIIKFSHKTADSFEEFIDDLISDI